MTARSAKGLRGHIIDSFDGNYYFRVYDADHNFTDYDLRHTDMRIRIIDSDAFFYSDEQGDSIDHAPATLGIKHGNVCHDPIPR